MLYTYMLLCLVCLFDLACFSFFLLISHLKTCTLPQVLRTSSPSSPSSLRRSLTSSFSHLVSAAQGISASLTREQVNNRLVTLTHSPLTHLTHTLHSHTHHSHTSLTHSPLTHLTHTHTHPSHTHSPLTHLTHNSHTSLTHLTHTLTTHTRTHHSHTSLTHSPLTHLTHTHHSHTSLIHSPLTHLTHALTTHTRHSHTHHSQTSLTTITCIPCSLLYSCQKQCSQWERPFRACSTAVPCYSYSQETVE